MRSTKKYKHKALKDRRRKIKTVPKPKESKNIIEKSIRGIKLWFKFASEMDRGRARRAADSETENIDWLDTITKNDVFYDVGPSIGHYSMYAAKKYKCRTFAFEPNILTFVTLNTNIAMNELDTVAYNVAIDSKLSLDTFYYRSFESSTALHSFTERSIGLVEKWDPVITTGCVGVSIDQLWEKFRLPFPTYIKIDTDGNEFKVLKGMQKTMRDPRFKTMIIEEDYRFMDKFEFKRLTKPLVRVADKSTKTNSVYIK